MSTEAINDIATWIALAAFLPFFAFTCIYGIGSPWYRSLLGVVMFSLGTSISAVLAFNVIRRFHGAFPGYEWWAVSLYSWLTLTGVALVAIVIYERRRVPLLQIPLKRKALIVSIPLDPAEYKNGEKIETAKAELVTLPLDRTTRADGTPTWMPQAKVIAGLVWSVILIVVVAAITAITPDLFAWAGQWAGVIYAGIVALGGALAAYIKKPSARAF